MPTSVAIVLAQTQPQPPAPGADRGEEFGSSSPIALVVILLLGIAMVFLIRSMNKRLRKVPASFEPQDQAAAADAAPEEEPTTPGTPGTEAAAPRERGSPDA